MLSKFWYLFQFLIIIQLCNCEISKFLRQYIESKRSVKKYIITTLVDYEKNQNSLVEENLVLNLQDYISITESFRLKNKTLNVSVFSTDNNEFDCFISKNGKNETDIKGFSIDLLKSIQEILQFKIKFNIIEFSTKENITTEELLLSNNTSDLILCHPDLNISLTEILFPTFESSYVLIYKANNVGFTEDIFILTFAGTLWLCFIIVLILLAISLRISTKQYNRIYGHPEWGSVEITFWAIATACQQGLTSIPYGFASRLIIFLGALTAYLLYTGFAAGITSLVAVQNKQISITISDIEKMKLNVVSFGNLVHLPIKYDYLRNSWNAPNLESFFGELNKKNWIGITLQIFLDQHFNKKGNENDPCLYMTTVIKESKHFMSNLVPKKSHLKKIFNYWFMRFRMHGIRSINQTSNNQNYCDTFTSGSNYSSARLEHVKSAILVLLVGLIASTIFVICECIWNGYVHRKARKSIRHRKNVTKN